MNRKQRRASVARQGGSWQREKAAARASAQSNTMALRMTPQQALEALARWASTPGRTQAEVDALNAKAGASVIEADE